MSDDDGLRDGGNDGIQGSNKMKRLSGYLELVRKKVCYERKFKVREKLHRFRSESEVDNKEKDPLLLFPVEVWTMIFECLNDPEDLISCAISYPSFQCILEESKVQWLFAKVFPILLPYLISGVKKDYVRNVLTCRLVCEPWRCSVDRHFENSVEDLRKVFGDEAVLKIPIRLGSAYTCGSWRRLHKLARRVGKPIVGRSVILETTVIDSSPRFDMAPAPDAILALSKFLHCYGRHILHLRHTSSSVVVRYPTLAEYFYMCYVILTECRNLRTLTLHGKIQDICVSGAIVCEPLPRHSNLETLEVLMDYPCTLQIQDKLIEIYSSQLRRLSVNFWNYSHYHQLPWDNLAELAITHPHPVHEIISSLSELRAPRLRKLKFTDIFDSWSLDRLMDMILTFPKLDYLHLVNSHGNVGFIQNAEIITNMSKGFTCSMTVTTIEVEIPYQNNISFDFLICFPFLKRIVIRHKLPRNSNNFDNQQDIGSEENTDVLHFRKYLWKGNSYDRQGRAYKSRIWETHPFLHILETHNEYLSEWYGGMKCWTEVYTRDAIIRSRSDQLAAFNLYMNCAHAEADRQIEMKRKFWRQRIKGQVQNTQSRLNDCSELPDYHKYCPPMPEISAEIKMQGLLKKVFSKIYNHLEKQDILNCRQVCKIWCTSVDNFLEEKQKPRDSKISTLSEPNTDCFIDQQDTLDFLYHFRMPLDSSLMDSHDKFREAMALHHRNPFIGRTVALYITATHQGHTEVQSFTSIFGCHIRHAIIHCLVDFDLGIFTWRNYMAIYHTILTNCRNIRGIHIKLSGVHQLRTFSMDTTIDQELPDLPHLEYLDLQTAYSTTDNFFLLTGTARSLLSKYSNQLKVINTSVWNPTWTSFKFGALKDFSIDSQSSDIWLRNLTRIQAPNLTRLEITLDGLERKLMDFILITHNFSRLSEIRVRIPKYLSGPSVEEVLSITPGLISSAGLTSLEVFIDCVCPISFDFLVFFPFLKRLCFTFTHLDAHYKQSGSHKRRRDDDGFETCGKNNFICFPKHFWRFLKNNGEEVTDQLIYKSNIWQVLKFLEVLKFIKQALDTSTEDYNGGETKTFTRVQYFKCTEWVESKFEIKL